MKHRQVQHSTSTTHPICYAAARRLLRSLARKSARLASWAIGVFAAEIASLPKKGTGRLPAYRHSVASASASSFCNSLRTSSDFSLATSSFLTGAALCTHLAGFVARNTVLSTILWSDQMEVGRITRVRRMSRMSRCPVRT